ncbi:MAG TPA: translation elongation factor 4 [Victivallales bacterium]|nr:translation elongation factor 4 [Victivallales bacterium]
MKYIRNFSIIAHIDHGKSTLADRLLELTGTVPKRELQEQVLDDMDIERERGITIKSHPVRMLYKYIDGYDYELNLIDTPGHVDFTYEVSRALSACEGAILVIDATQGVQAQTVANLNLAHKQNLRIIPVINKIDLPAADISVCLEQIEEILAIPREEAIALSAKTGENVDKLLSAIVERISPPKNESKDYCRALIFDSLYDAYRGVVNYIRVFDGALVPGMKIRLLSNNVVGEVKEVGIFSPKMKAVDKLLSGSVGYVIPNIKSPHDTRIGDTIADFKAIDPQPLSGFKEVKPVVFSGIYPVDSSDYEQLKASMPKLRLNDSAFTYSAETSAALGFGFRCGFLGLLHMEIIQERLRREYNLDIISTYPSVIYKVFMKNGKCLEIDNPVLLPDPSLIDKMEEPFLLTKIITPNIYIGDIMNLIMSKRGVCIATESADSKHVVITADLPMSEILVDFHDKLKSITRGYASMDYQFNGYKEQKLVKLDIMVNGEPVDAFSAIVHVDHAQSKGRHICEKLKELIPPHLFQIAIQAAIGGKVVARENVRQLRKNVLAKCYGGDITRKRKLLEKQKEGKKRMKQFGQVNIPQEAFVEVLKTS